MAKTETTKEPKSKKEEPKKPAAKPAEVVTPLKVEVEFPHIHDLKQGIAFDSDMNLVLTIQFKAPVDQYEVARLVNLLKQPSGVLHATIGSNQSAMDFKFDPKAGQFVVTQAAKALVPGKKDKPAAGPPADGKVVFQDVTFNHFEKEDKPFGVFISYTDSDGVIHEKAGRGGSALEAVIAGIQSTGAIHRDMTEPFEVLAALKDIDVTPALNELLRVIEVGQIPTDKKEKAAKK